MPQNIDAMTNFFTTSSLYTTGRSAKAKSDIRLLPRQCQNRVLDVEMALDQPEVEHDGEYAQTKPEHRHLSIGRPGDEKQAYQAEHRHHQPDDQVTHVAFHVITFPQSAA